MMKHSGKVTWRRDFKLNGATYLLYLPVFVYLVIFSYLPMFGITMAFQDFKPKDGFFGSAWVGLKHFIDFFADPVFPQLLRNTLVISMLGLFTGMFLSLLFALLLEEIRYAAVKKAVQTVSYMPYFISAVVIAGFIIDFTSSSGLVVELLVAAFGIKRENLLTNPHYFWWINLASDLWQGLGYGSIIFIAALGGVSPEHHEAAAIDGASRLQRVWHVTLPAIRPTIVTMLVLRLGMALSVGGDKILLIYNPSVYATADVISTYVVRNGIGRMQYGYSAAVGLFNSVVGTFLLLVSNKIGKKLSETSIF
jgi:putative aldouronate transport system permease protein